MSDRFEPISLKSLLQYILNEYEHSKSIWGIPEELFFNPSKFKLFKTQQFNQLLDTPLGVAAGPHTQMAQNIIASWLVGARYMELKTIQTLDELEVAKPCIDMQDEGYNCEWSQELKIEQSFHEYLNAWIIIHILHHKLGFKGNINTIFNMSVGYNLEGIMKPNVQWFFHKMKDCSIELEMKINEIKDLYPEVVSLQIPSQLSDNITLSTMHGCPAHEIEEIASYLLTEKKLHTFVKLNPTLIGPTRLRTILNDALHFKTNVPDLAFEHDLKYEDALKIIHALHQKSVEVGLQFGLKLTNTLESVNHKTIFDSEVEMMYMSGRALHPISIQLANQLRQDLSIEIPFSFSAGVDAFNVADTLACGFSTITVCSDLLKPGGYMRMAQYVEELNKVFVATHSINIETYISNLATTNDLVKAGKINLKNYAQKVLTQNKYQRHYINTHDIKTPRYLTYFDCIAAPCIDTCATHQDIPNYLYYSELGNFKKAYKVILQTNPLPSITGMVCDHLCQNKCTRVHYDSTLLIREVKRFVSEQQEVCLKPVTSNGLTVGIIGAGPTGLTAAYYLALAGFEVSIYEAKSKAGGMVQYAIPGFRLTNESLERDFKRVTDLGVKIHFDHPVNKAFFKQIQSDFDYVYIGAGAQLSADFSLEGNDAIGVLDPLQFLFNVRKNQESGLGNQVLIIGGGNTAMDAARTAKRMVDKNGKVSIVYRRTIQEMPADEIEIKAVLEENVEILEMVTPEKVVTENNRVTALICSKMKFEGKDASGRPKPVNIPDSEFIIPCDTIIPALGQKVDIDFASQEELKTNGYQTQMDNVWIGGDAFRNASTAINAIGDGRKVAAEMIEKAKKDNRLHWIQEKNHTKKDLILKRARRIHSDVEWEIPISERNGFQLVSRTLSLDEVQKEAARCLHCDEICNICTTVCPNFANYSYEIEPVFYALQKIVTVENKHFQIESDVDFYVHQSHQILNIDNFCNECGNCTTFCPTKSAPYIEKPKVFLTQNSFDKNNYGFFCTLIDGNPTLLHKKDGKQYSLTQTTNQYWFETDSFFVQLNKETFEIEQFKPKTNETSELRLTIAAEMSVIMKGIGKLNIINKEVN